MVVKKRNVIVLTISIFLVLLIFSGCTNNGNVEENTNNIDKYASKETDINYEIEKIDEGTTIKNYIYSPDEANYFIEENYIYTDSELGPYGTYNIYLNGNLKPMGYAYFVNLEKNLSPNSIIWINNEEVVVLEENDSVGRFKLYILNVITGKKEELKFQDLRVYYNGNLSVESNKLTFIIRNGDFIKVFTYDISNNISEEIYYYKYLSIQTVNSVWGINDYIYFDVAEVNKNDRDIIYNIKRYDLNTKNIEDFKDNAKILNISPNNRYLTYIDKSTDEMAILDIINDFEIKLPISIEFIWNKSSDEFAYVESNNYIVKNIINGKNIEKEKYNIDYLLEGKDKILNLQFVKNEIRFDIVSYNDNVPGIKKVTTYRIIKKAHD